MQKSWTFGVDRTSAWLGRVALVYDRVGWAIALVYSLVGWAIALVHGCVCMVGYCTSAQLGTRVELGLDECEGGLSWRQSPASVAKGPIVHSRTTTVRFKGSTHTSEMLLWQKSGS